MTAKHTVTLVCDMEPDCPATWVSAYGLTSERARALAVVDGWSSHRHYRDGCPDHPARPGRRRADPPGGTVIRLYDQHGLLLYVATTKGSPTGRLRTLRAQARHDWWPLVDPARTLVAPVPDDTDAAKEREDIVGREHPRFFRDENGGLPYLHNTRIIPPRLPSTPLTRLRTKRSHR